MTQYDNNMRGTFGRNQRKQRDSQPDFSGKCEIENVKYYIDGWIKQGPTGQFFSLSFKPMEPKQNAPANAPASAPAEEFDDIPF